MQDVNVLPRELHQIRRNRKTMAEKDSGFQCEMEGGAVCIRRNGLATVLRYGYFPLWSERVLKEIPIRSCRPSGKKWVVKGALKVPAGEWRVVDTLSQQGNTLRIDRAWDFRGSLQSNIRLGMDLQVPFQKLDFWAIPYISMNGNQGSSTVPAGMTRNGSPWIFREERTTAPGMMALEKGGVVAGTYTEAGRCERTLSACSIVPQKEGFTLRTFFPSKEGPRTFLGAAHPGNAGFPEQGLYAGSSGNGNGIRVEGRARFRRSFFVVLDQGSEKKHGYVRVWESAWRNLRDPIPEPIAVKKMERLLWKSLEPFWYSKGKVRGYITRIDRKGDRYGGFSPTLSCGWCAPTMMLAYLALRKSSITGNAHYLQKPIGAANFFIEKASQKNGVCRTHYNIKKMAWSEGNINAVQLGGASLWMLRCVQYIEENAKLAKKINLKKWKGFALNFCDLAIRTQRNDGSFAAHWDEKGNCLGHERSMGVHSARAVLEAYRLTGDGKYLNAAESGAEFYILNCIDKESGYGDCTDILNSTTENDGVGVPDFYIDLYRVTGKKRYLKKAVRAAEYCLAYMFAYNLYFSPETECGRRKMRTRGFPTISPETGFVCFWFVHQANAFLELWKETNEKKWKAYAVALIRASLQMICKKGDLFGLDPKLVGTRAEVIPVIDTVKGGFVWKKGMTGYTWHQPVWWPAAFNLQNFAYVQDRFPEVLKEIEGEG